ncbi:hypothetical protein ACG33_01600 [Steroidobacter denitrificans]|uniref:TPM domain-containing protein n=1 Tax=Steroidobacter denitrificans TaxID=465721 RepID=A0A127F860_STEDE|nr:TPM domain-containing protein [Steroidobacter denitrificans]AMN45821.1 hypothetical protein ACG33_01600 [Steroidobacter denitrificans]
MRIARLFRHLTSTSWGLRRRFDRACLDAIEDAIEQCERGQGGEIRVAIEGKLELVDLMRRITPRERALQVFGQLRTWDTQDNNGVLIYVLWADRDVEIVADRGYNQRVSALQWQDICRRMERWFASGDNTRALILGVREVSELVALHFPKADRNELPNRPVIM